MIKCIKITVNHEMGMVVSAESLVMLSARLSVSSENVNPVALLTSLLMHDYMLPKLMLKQAPNFNVSAGGKINASENVKSSFRVTTYKARVIFL